MEDGKASELRGLKVLVIDDSKTIRRTAETLLSKEGCEVFTAVEDLYAAADLYEQLGNVHRRTGVLTRSARVKS